MQYNHLQLVILWVSTVYFSDTVCCNYLSILQRLIPYDWMLQCSICNTMDYKDDIEANEYIMTIIKYILPFKLNTDDPRATEQK